MNNIELQLDYTKILSFFNVTDEQKAKAASDFGQNLAYLLDRNGCDAYYSRSILLTTINAHISDKLAYHTPFHVLSILSFAQLNNIPLEDWELFAIFYHDVIYRSGSKKNEINSLQFMISLLSDTGIPQAILAKAASGIQATAMHLDEFVDPVTEKLLDLDLHSFSFDSAAFSEINKAIKLEFCRENDKKFKGCTLMEYYTGRKAFLEKLNSKKSIFRTSYFQEYFESTARENLLYEIELVEKQLKNI